MRLQSPLQVSFVPGRPSNPPDLNAEVARGFAGQATDWNANFAFAYATMEGVNALLIPFESSHRWSHTHQNWDCRSPSGHN